MNTRDRIAIRVPGVPAPSMKHSSLDGDFLAECGEEIADEACEKLTHGRL